MPIDIKRENFHLTEIIIVGVTGTMWVASSSIVSLEGKGFVRIFVLAALFS